MLAALQRLDLIELGAFELLDSLLVRLLVLTLLLLRHGSSELFARLYHFVKVELGFDGTRGPHRQHLAILTTSTRIGDLETHHLLACIGHQKDEQKGGSASPEQDLCQTLYQKAIRRSR